MCLGQKKKKDEVERKKNKKIMNESYIYLTYLRGRSELVILFFYRFSSSFLLVITFLCHSFFFMDLLRLVLFQSARFGV